MTNKAKLISIDEDEGGLALLLINGVEIGAMNCLGYGICDTPYPTIGSFFEPKFSCLFDENLDVDWHTVFEGNPDQEKRMHRIGVWSYRALGRIVEIEVDSYTALADCGGCLIPLPITMYDSDYIGAYVGFDISRLNVWRK